MSTLTKNKRTGGLMILCSLLLLLLAGCGKHEKEPVISLEQLEQAGIKIAVALDSPQESSLAQDYPKAELIPYRKQRSVCASPRDSHSACRLREELFSSIGSPFLMDLMPPYPFIRHCYPLLFTILKMLSLNSCITFSTVSRRYH